MKRRGLKPLDLSSEDQEKAVIKRVPFTLSKAQSKAMRDQMFDVDGYKSTEKSKWLAEALMSLLASKNWMKVVEGVMVSQREATDSHISLMNERLKLSLDEACLDLKKRAFEGEIVKVRAPVAAIMRAAVMHRVNPVSDHLSTIIASAKAHMKEEGIKS